MYRVQTLRKVAAWRNSELAIMVRPGKASIINVGNKRGVEVPVSRLVERLDRSGWWILVHTHPGSAAPSADDHTATMKLAWISEVCLGSSMIDHWIFGDDGDAFFYSREAPQYLRPEVMIGPGR